MVDRAKILELVGRAIQPLKDRLYLMIGRGVLTALASGNGLMRAQFTGFGADPGDDPMDGREVFFDYGFSCRPHPGAEPLVAALAGLRSNSVVVRIADSRYQIALADGEVAIHDDLGQKVHLTRTGVVVETPLNATVAAGQKLRLEATDIELHAAETLSWDVDGYGKRLSSLGDGVWMETTWQQGAVMAPAEVLPIAPPEGPGA